MQKFKTTVDSKHKFLDLKLKETFSYKDLIFLFVKRDFVARYKQTILGPLWVIIQPLFTSLINVLVFGVIAGLGGYDIDPDKAVPTYLFLMAGSVCWSYMSTTINGTMNTFISNSGIMGKVYYPRLVSPLATMFSNLINFAIQMLILVGVGIVYALKGANSIALTPWMLMFPITLLQMMLFSVGTGLFFSSFTTKYRDLTMFFGFFLSLVGYLSPIHYGYYAIYENFAKYVWLQKIYMLNPVTNMVLTFKYSLFGTGVFQIGWYLVSWVMTVIMLILGILMFNKTERTFMDTI